jgi:hypothetical protein
MQRKKKIAPGVVRRQNRYNLMILNIFIQSIQMRIRDEILRRKKNDSAKRGCAPALYAGHS